MKNVMGEHFSGGQIPWENCTGGNYLGGGAIFRGGLMEVSSPGRNSSVTGLGLCVDH